MSREASEEGAGSRTPLTVVLGASGFIGSAVSKALAARPIRLRLVARRPTPVPVDAVARVEVVAADLTNRDAVAETLQDADVVVHLIACTDGGWRVTSSDSLSERVNVGIVNDVIDVLGTRREGARTAVLYAGSGLIEDQSEQSTEYCRQKLTAERLLRRADEEGILRSASLRLPAAYGNGPASDPRVVEIMIRRALSGKPLTMWHDGSVRRDLIHLDDVAAAFTAAIDRLDELCGRHWLVGTDQAEPLGRVFAEIADIVAERTGQPPVPVVFVPPPPHAHANDLKSLEIDSSAFRAVTGWRPHVSLREGLTRTVDEIARAIEQSGEQAVTST